MSVIDAAAKKYMQNNAIAADAANLVLFHGEPKIRPEELVDLDPSALLELSDSLIPAEYRQTYRDLLKGACLKRDRNCCYLILGYENESKIDYSMPIRTLVYDAVQYLQQKNEIQAKYRRQKDYAGREKGEYLSLFYAEDRILPVVTILMYFGPGKWYGPRSLRAMMNIEDPEILEVVNDWMLHIFEPYAMGEEEFGKMRTNLKQVAEFLKYSQDKKRIAELLKEDEEFRHLDRDAADVLRRATNFRIPMEEQEEQIDMCKAIDDMMQDSRMEGMARGIAKGKAEEKTEIILRMKAMGFSEEVIAEAAGCSQEQVQQLSAKAA